MGRECHEITSHWSYFGIDKLRVHIIFARIVATTKENKAKTKEKLKYFSRQRIKEISF